MGPDGRKSRGRGAAISSHVTVIWAAVRQWRGKLSSCGERSSLSEEDNVRNCGIAHGSGMSVVCHNEVGPGTEVTSARLISAMSEGKKKTQPF
jgi:hypothetical protein